MIDLFADEQKTYDDAVKYKETNGSDTYVDKAQYDMIVQEYGKLLKQMRRITKMSDRATDSLNKSRLDLLDKVHIDIMTGIYNRRYLDENLNRIIKSLSRAGGMLSVLMLDVDRFKQYNDTYGHNKGDICLKIIAEVITSSLSRVDDFAARYGGEEFTVILPGTNERGARLVANKILLNMAERRIPHETSDVDEFVTLSIGAASSIVDHVQTGGDYIKRADKALYMSKNSGRNRYTFIDYHMYEEK